MVMRPVVSVFSATEEKRVGSTVMPRVFGSSLRNDLVKYVHMNMSKNRRQAYAVSKNSGYQTSAASWGTGRALSRVPRVHGGGTHRAGQAAYANFCRAGGMFAPTRVWRRWHRRINLKERRQAIAAALASTAVVPLVMARGHRIEGATEIPLVVEDSIETLTKTKDAVKLLLNLGLGPELERVAKPRAKAGRGKGRKGSKRHPIGPLIIMRASAIEGRRAFRNIPGVQVAAVERLNLLKLAPAGTLGRLCVFSKSAFEALDEHTKPSTSSMLASANVTALVNSSNVQLALKAPIKGTPKATIKRHCNKRILKFVRHHLKKQQKDSKKPSATPALKKASKAFYKNVMAALAPAPVEDVVAEE
ncbi:bifunctional Ribosomal protein L4 domain superfamily/Ribosomal protein L4-L1e/Ribosomal protein L4 [Babesia duncani]|uniref:Bifunctional Ribosomal protein L4 domain superfamily/Ribosomal protein L4-L1e/Ribosomal protein L4 n=1 Tax=Babesia duncani TaxID=323732 RepID=A0AAD9PJH7_9APIC|nr:bifunctional Ribosomal protein L4 domain superfamily/Ribosomal protein L4-L1e/Ribosomal protein L4 [Babesia duncani]